MPAAILYEDRSALAIDKPAGWMLAPTTWRHTSRNLQRALMESVQAREFWAVSRRLRFIRYVHRLDAETSGVLLLAKSPGALTVLGKLFESREVTKKYLAVVRGVPAQAEWICRLKLTDQIDSFGRVRVDEKGGRDAETRFRVLERRDDTALVEAVPVTGRTHQIRVHLQAQGNAVVGDELYGGGSGGLALRAVELAYVDPFQKRRVKIHAAVDEFLTRFFAGEHRGIK